MSRTLAVCVLGVVMAAGCSAGSEATIQAPISAPTIRVEPAEDVAPTTVSAPATIAAATTSTTSTSLAPPTTSASTAAPTTRPNSSSTGSSGGNSGNTGPSNALIPAFFAFDVSAVEPCPVDGSGREQKVTISWEVIGTESVYVAIDNEFDPATPPLAPAGQVVLPHTCPGGNTYFVVAENPDGRSVQSASRP